MVLAGMSCKLLMTDGITSKQTNTKVELSVCQVESV